MINLYYLFMIGEIIYQKSKADLSTPKLCKLRSSKIGFTVSKAFLKSMKKRRA